MYMCVCLCVHLYVSCFLTIIYVLVLLLVLQLSLLYSAAASSDLLQIVSEYCVHTTFAGNETCSRDHIYLISSIEAVCVLTACSATME